MMQLDLLATVARLSLAVSTNAILMKHLEWPSYQQKARADSNKCSAAAVSESTTL